MKQLDITIYKAYITNYTLEDKVQVGNDLWMLTFDERHDFIFNDRTAGIALRLDISNERVLNDPARGARHLLRLTVIDNTDRAELHTVQRRVSIHKSEVLHTEIFDLPLAAVPFRADHGYRLAVYDETARQMLGEYRFRFYGQRPLLHESEWYQAEECGVRPDWEARLYKNLKTIDDKDYYVRFHLRQNFGSAAPLILPEVEMRLYFPDGGRIETHFAEPIVRNGEMFVEQPFRVSDENGGVFYAELLCMDFPVAGFVFSSKGPDEPGYLLGDLTRPLDEYSLAAARERLELTMPVAASVLKQSEGTVGPEPQAEPAESPEPESDEPESSEPEASEPEVTLNDLTGLKAVKEKLAVYEKLVHFNRMRADIGLPTPSQPLHSMFLGSPGTGKTTVAKLIGSMLHRAGVLSKGHVVVRERSTLLGQYYSSESEKTLAAIEEAKGGILFIDEAYQLFQADDSRDPGKFVIETLLTALSDPARRDWMLILAGYTGPMLRMFEMNPGLKSRIPRSNIYTFEDFTRAELMEIAENYLTRNRFELTGDARVALETRLLCDYLVRDQTFGNARHVLNLIQTEILPAMAVRIISQNETSPQALTQITADDIPAPKHPLPLLSAK